MHCAIRGANVASAGLKYVQVAMSQNWMLVAARAIHRTLMS